MEAPEIFTSSQRNRLFLHPQIPFSAFDHHFDMELVPPLADGMRESTRIHCMLNINSLFL